MKEWVSDACLDLRFAVRTLTKRRGFATVAILTLALGIGAATAVFSIVDAVLLRPLPYKDPARLTAVWITSTREPGLAKVFATHADYTEFRSHSRTFENVNAATWATNTTRVLTGVGPAREVLTIPASASFFKTLGVPAAMGRTFSADDEGHGCSIVLAHKFWESALGADRSLIGKTLTLDQNPCIVLGVMPETFSFYPAQTQAWVLLGPDYQADQGKLLVGIFARLKPGVTLAQAEAELRSLYRALHPDIATRDFEPVVYDLHGEFTFLAGRTLHTTLILVFSAVLLVLLIACLNVANLLLGRLSERRRELAVRAALGSARSRLIRQVLTEGLLLSGCGAVLGVAIAYAALEYFRNASPIELTVGANVRLGPPLLGFSIALAIATTLVFGLLPALRASKVDLAANLKTGGRGSIQGRYGLAKAVIAIEMALSFMLLIGASLLMTSALRMGSESLGFTPERTLATHVSLPIFRFPTDSQRVQAYDRLLERLEQVPGAAGVALASRIPPDAGGNQVLEVQGRPVAAGRETHDAGEDAVSPEFFDVLNIPLRRGRAFGAQDRENSEPVALVNEALAKEYFPNADPVGQQIRIPGGASPNPMPWLTVVGVVGNLKHTTLMNEMSWVATPIFYRPLAQEPRQSMGIVMRTAGDEGSVVQEMQRQIAAVDPSIPVNEVETLTARLSKPLAYPRFRAMVLGFFALSALLLAAVGLHGLLSHLVAQRIPEFGLRRAVGAQTHDLLLLVARQGGRPVLAGLAAGVCLTLAFSRLLGNLLYGIQPADPNVLAIGSVALLAVAALAILSPATHAARVDPMVALRDE